MLKNSSHPEQDQILQVEIIFIFNLIKVKATYFFVVPAQPTLIFGKLIKIILIYHS